MKRTLVFITVFLIVAVHTNMAHAGGNTLLSVCGPENQVASLGNTQLGNLCQASYTAGNGWIVQDNLTRVRTAVAVTCAYNCLSGGLISSCSPGSAGLAGNDSCNTAVNTGYGAYTSNQASSQDYLSARGTGGTGLNLRSNTDSTVSTSGAAVNSGVAPIPTSCQSAAESGNVSDRINCAVASDPSLPSFVQSPQFLTDFQKATGQSLQSVINQSGSNIANSYGPSAIQSALSSLGGKVSMTDFLSRGASLVSAIASKLTSKGDQAQLIANVVPSSLRGLIPGIDDLPAQSPAQASALARADTGAGNPMGDNQASSSGILDRKISSTLGLDSDPSVSLFDRVSVQYQLQYKASSVQHLDWSTPMNQALTRQ